MTNSGELIQRGAFVMQTAPASIRLRVCSRVRVIWIRRASAAEALVDSAVPGSPASKELQRRREWELLSSRSYLILAASVKAVSLSFSRARLDFYCRYPVVSDSIFVGEALTLFALGAVLYWEVPFGMRYRWITVFGPVIFLWDFQVYCMASGTDFTRND